MSIRKFIHSKHHYNSPRSATTSQLNKYLEPSALYNATEDNNYTHVTNTTGQETIEYIDNIILSVATLLLTGLTPTVIQLLISIVITVVASASLPGRDVFIGSSRWTLDFDPSLL